MFETVVPLSVSCGVVPNPEEIELCRRKKARMPLMRVRPTKRLTRLTLTRRNLMRERCPHGFGQATQKCSSAVVGTLELCLCPSRCTDVAWVFVDFVRVPACWHDECLVAGVWSYKERW